MNRSALLHVSDIPYCEYLGNGRLFLRLRTAKEDRDLDVGVYYGNKYLLPRNKKSYAKMAAREIDADFANFETVLELDDKRVGYVFSIKENGREYFYSETGLADSYDFRQSYKDFFQCPYCHESMAMHIPDWAYRACFYQIFVDRFQIGDKGKDLSYAKMKWGGKSILAHAGGDLRGIIDSLDYLKDLGINALYLTPIFLSDTYHKYDTLDYFRVDPRFGTEEDLKELLAKSHDRGIRIVLDAVFNHMSFRSVYFQDVLEKGKASPYYDMFYIKGDKPDLDKGNYEMFSSGKWMPKINAESPLGEELLTKVALHYLEMGIDGWRLDVADEVSHAFWKKLRIKVKEKFPDALLIGELWHDGASFLRGDEWDGAMDFPFMNAAIAYLAEKKDDAKAASDRLNALLSKNRLMAQRMFLNFLDNHDTNRFLNLAKGNEKALAAALALLVFYIGMPCLYYGTEIPMDGGFDPDCRRCFDAEEARKDNPYRRLLRKLLALRKEDILSYGDIEIREEGGLLSIKRSHEGKTFQLLINAGPEPLPLKAGNVLIDLNYEKGMIYPDGFVIRRI